MRTPEEVLRQIEGLKKLKESLPQFSFFGDNNWEPIDAQLNILESRNTYEDYDAVEDGEIESAAYQAEQWLLCKSDEDLFEE